MHIDELVPFLRYNISINNFEIKLYILFLAYMCLKQLIKKQKTKIKKEEINISFRNQLFSTSTI